MTYQKCPVCLGAGTVPQSFNINSSVTPMLISCRICIGSGIISELTGKPPQQGENKSPETVANEMQEPLSDSSKKCKFFSDIGVKACESNRKPHEIIEYAYNEGEKAGRKECIDRVVGVIQDSSNVISVNSLLIWLKHEQSKQ